MSILDSILGQVTQNATVAGLAAKVGLTPEQVESAVAALAAAHTQPGDTATAAAEQTGLPADTMSEIIGHIGGEGSLGTFASMVAESGAAGGILGKLKGMFS